MLPTLIEAIRAACADAPDLQAAVLFGSALESDCPNDVDLALLWPADVPVEARFRRATRVAAEIEHRIAETGLNVDVKDLRALPISLQFRVLREGRRVTVRDQRAWVRFQSDTVPLALDFLPFHRRALVEAAHRLARG